MNWDKIKFNDIISSRKNTKWFEMNYFGLKMELFWAENSLILLNDHQVNHYCLDNKYIKCLGGTQVM